MEVFSPPQAYPMQNIKRPSLRNQWNLVSLSRLSDSQTESIEMQLGYSPFYFPEGLLPAANEILAGWRNQPVSLAYSEMDRKNWVSPYEMEDTCNVEPYLESDNTFTECPLIARIRQGPPSLLRSSSSSPACPNKLLSRICSNFPEQNVVIVAKAHLNECSFDQGITLARTLRKDGHNASYKNMEEEDAPTSRIRICHITKLDLASVKVWAADILVILDAAEFVNYGFGGAGSPFDHTDLFASYGTFIKEGCRLVGITPEDAHPTDLRKIWPTFGINEFLLAQDGTIAEPPKVKLEGYAKADAPNFIPGDANSLLVQKKHLIWNNQTRNAFLAGLAAKALLPGKGTYTHADFPPLHNGNAVGVVVENRVHQQAVEEILASQGLGIPVLTFEEINALGAAIPKTLIRGDGGVGLLPLGKVLKEITIIDVKDKMHGFPRSAFLKRRQEYARHWSLGANPYCSKWQATKAAFVGSRQSNY